MSFHIAALVSKVKTTLTEVNTSLVVFCNLPVNQLNSQSYNSFQIEAKVSFFSSYSTKKPANV